jgi:hypothetical protein
MRVTKDYWTSEEHVYHERKKKKMQLERNSLLREKVKTFL